MFNINQLDNGFKEFLSIVNFKGGFDTFKFRKGYEDNTTISNAEKEEILDYLKTKMPKISFPYQLVRSQINQKEFLLTDYYASPYPRNFRGAYAPVVLKTFAGIMTICL